MFKALARWILRDEKEFNKWVTNNYESVAIDMNRIAGETLHEVKKIWERLIRDEQEKIESLQARKAVLQKQLDAFNK